MSNFGRELETALVQAVETWRGSLVHIGGSGIPYRTGIVVKEGLVATLARSARDGEEVPVVTAAGELTGRVEAWDGESGLALIKIDSGAVPVPPGAVQNGPISPAVGTPVLRLAFASPQGVEASLSIVRFSGGPSNWGRRSVPAHFQVDGSAFPGFLGAAVVDLGGTFRGVVVSNEDGNEGWVLPAAAWTAAVEELTREGTRLRGWLGISLGTVRLSPAQAESAGRETALLVREVVPEGPGSVGGLQPGDLILNSDGVEITDGEIPSLRADTPVVLDILRGTERQSLRVVPAPRP